ncbi:unnamed protein product [Larinioides sclopetarius]|uniref:Site-specific DNA endonuclease n=1 Tax=Larinioides sclopetarius TaxID=280406 RepID=A0AAV2BNP5_9ARAC
MGHLGSPLLEFLKNSIREKKYTNLKSDSSGLIFSITLPHKRKLRNMEEYEEIFKDWYKVKGKAYIPKNYIRAKQALTASLKRSVYVEKVRNCQKKLTYRILSGNEVEAKKLLKKKRREKVEREPPNNYVNPQSVDSAYGSGVDSPPSHPGLNNSASTEEYLQIFWNFLLEQNMSVEELDKLADELLQTPTVLTNEISNAI